ncbi:MAG TPA: histidine phosphatase family protein [Mobilitalea sp.]|nr:histidine phosphatase family protein [Mobilitalea sp.]
MTTIYFVRHAQPDEAVKNDRLRPLTEEGIRDTKAVTAFLKDRDIRLLMSSPYKRSRDTIKDLADTLHMHIHTDEALREREIGIGYLGDPDGYIKRMWADFHFKSEGAECLAELQLRNILAIKKLLNEHSNENIVIGTHGSALSTMLNYYDSQYGYEDFIRMIHYFPYIVQVKFEGETYLGRSEELIIEK